MVAVEDLEPGKVEAAIILLDLHEDLPNDLSLRSFPLFSYTLIFRNKHTFVKMLLNQSFQVAVKVVLSKC